MRSEGGGLGVRVRSEGGGLGGTISDLSEINSCSMQ